MSRIRCGLLIQVLASGKPHTCRPRALPPNHLPPNDRVTLLPLRLRYSKTRRCSRSQLSTRHPFRKLNSLGSASRRLQRSFGGILSIDRGFKRDHCASWQDQTADFYTTSDDLHQLQQGAPPFCTATCNSMSYAPSPLSYKPID